MDLEFLEAISSVNFKIKGDDGTASDPYKNLESTLQPYAHRLSQFSENISFNKNADGSEDCSHTLQIQYRPAQGQDPMAISKDIAKDIFENQRPDFPYVKNLIDLDHAATSDIKDGDIFSETYDKISGKCNFTRTIRRFPIGLAGDDNNRFKKVYVLNRVGAGYIEISEKCDVYNAKGIKGDKFIVGQMDDENALRAEFANSHANCQAKAADLGYSGSTLANVTVEVTRYRSRIDRRVGYEVKYSSDPRISSSGMTIDRKYDLSRDAAGVITIASEHTAKPMTGKKFTSTHLAKAKTNIEAGVDNSLIYNYGGTLKTIQESHNRSVWGSKYTIKYTVTDDTSIYLLDNTSLYSKKEINVDNSAPVRMKETYTIAGFGEVMHLSPQSEVGTLKISFKGQAKRNKLYNALTYGKLYNQDLLLNEAASACSVFFGTIISPTQLVITDTSYGMSSGGEISFDVEVQYTKASRTNTLETRT